jgi:hypothetical protein
MNVSFAILISMAFVLFLLAVWNMGHNAQPPMW